MRVGVARRVEPGTPPARGLQPTRRTVHEESESGSGKMVKGKMGEDLEPSAVEEDTGRLPTPEAWSASITDTTTRTDATTAASLTELVEAHSDATSAVEMTEGLEVKSISAGDPASALASPR